MATIKRMTAQSKVNIAAAKKATMEPSGIGYRVILEGDTGKTIAIKDADGDLVYSSMAAAKKAVTTHNNTLFPTLKAEI